MHTCKNIERWQIKYDLLSSADTLTRNRRVGQKRLSTCGWMIPGIRRSGCGNLKWWPKRPLRWKRDSGSIYATVEGPAEAYQTFWRENLINRPYTRGLKRALAPWSAKIMSRDMWQCLLRWQCNIFGFQDRGGTVVMMLHETTHKSEKPMCFGPIMF